MTKVMLIRPSQIRWKNEAKRTSAPIGLLSIASVLRENNIEVLVLDSAVQGYQKEREIKKNIIEYGLDENEIKKIILDFKPDYVGINATHTSYWNQQKNLAQLVKSINPDIKVLLGGHHASGAANYIIENIKEIDHIFIGEAESSIINLIKNKIQDKIIIGKKEDLSKLPVPSFELISSTDYNFKMSHYGKPLKNNFITNVISRGCPIGCDFCTTPHLLGKKVRLYNLDNVIEQISLIKNKGFEEYVSQDDNILTWPKNYRDEFFKILKNSNLPWVLDGGLYYPLVTDSFAKQLANNGCYRVFLPVESPDIEIMHNNGKYKKIINPDSQIRKVKEATNFLNKYNIEFYSAIMIGFPGQTWDSIKNSLEYAYILKDLGAIGVGFHWAHPYPHTPFYESHYHLVPKERKWETNPEYYSVIKPVFPIYGIDLETAEEYVNTVFKDINSTSYLNNSYEYNAK